ncbi:replication-associated recombination protein A, partial [Candidatus Dojkabacteria bacterium]|nr:replication-associated recombination protein A [Candidatus Dojkabacteria bacterium]
MQPLATTLRPQNLDEFIGQQHLVGEQGPIKKLLDSGKVVSMIFWGPPASGKTTLAEIIASNVESDFVRLSAVVDGKAQLKQIIEQASQNKLLGKQTILFIDEIHRWNKAQQDALLPYVESGDITLIGATTENPSFTVISPLLSRSRVFVFNSHSNEDILQGLERAVAHLKLKVKPEILQQLAEYSNGDMRFALNTLEIAFELAGKKKITPDIISAAAQRFLRHDRQGEEHYNVISAVHKSLRSSNASAAVYWITRMLQAGEDPLYIARRLVRFASEDIGNANPNALLLANIVYDTCAKLGMPECDVALVQLAEYLANSKKSNSAYTASAMAKADVEKYG